ncbi:MAG: GLPGLI family protein [Ekhidna sp.]|nr:GLPGLI family protein [Ekhidna sp.]
MKKVIFIFIYALCAGVDSYSQEIKGVAIYNAKLAEDNFPFKGSLYFDSNRSIYISKQNNNPVWKIKRESYEGAYLDILSDKVYTDTVGHLVFKKINTPTLTVRDFCDKNKPFIYDDFVEIDWRIKSETKMIADLKCTRATTSFRGRRYEAWFAPEIPVPYGPWKFNGLPGLIVKLED